MTIGEFNSLVQLNSPVHEKASCDSIVVKRSWRNEWRQWKTIHSSPVSNDNRYTHCWKRNIHNRI